MGRVDSTKLAMALGILLAAFFLRAYQLDLQIVTGDEWHALHKVIADDASGIVSSFGAADHSIPITLYFEVMSNTFGLSHWTLYLPFLISGLMVVILVPTIFGRYVGLPSAALLACFLALSSYFIAYSRFARPYMPGIN